MPISHKFKTIFVHIPKTGGSSIEQALEVFGHDNKGSLRVDENILYGYRGHPNNALQHRTAAEIKDFVSDNIYNTYFKFAFVRNPYDRVVSEYFWRSHFSMNMSFKDFLIKEVQPKKHVYRHYMDQYEFITNKDGNILVDFVGRFESFEKDLNYVKNRLGINLKMSIVNSVKPLNFIHYSDYYDEETKKLVGQIYEKDLAMFSYEFKTLNFVSRSLKKIIMIIKSAVYLIRLLIKKIPWLYMLATKIKGKRK